MIGAGETGEIAAKHLSEKGIGSLAVTNRTQEKADKLAQKLNAKVIPFTEFKDSIYKFDIIISATASPEIILKKDDVKISFVDGKLSISGERNQETEHKDSKCHRVERSFGKYYRSFNLPEHVQSDKINAEFNDGQLTISVPKAEEAKPKEIEIKVK